MSNLEALFDLSPFLGCLGRLSLHVEADQPERLMEQAPVGLVCKLCGNIFGMVFTPITPETTPLVAACAACVAEVVNEDPSGCPARVLSHVDLNLGNHRSSNEAPLRPPHFLKVHDLEASHASALVPLELDSQS